MGREARHEVSTCADLKCVNGGVLELATSWLTGFSGWLPDLADSFSIIPKAAASSAA